MGKGQCGSRPLKCAEGKKRLEIRAHKDIWTLFCITVSYSLTVGVIVTFPLGFLELPARGLDVALNQGSDDLLSVGKLAVFRALIRALTHVSHQILVQSVKKM